MALILLLHNISIILRLKDDMKRRLISRISNFKFQKKSFERFKNYSLICLNVYKTANRSPSIRTNQILLSSIRLELPPWSFTYVFKKTETTIGWTCISKALSFLQITAEHEDYPVFAVFKTIKTTSQNISIPQIQISLKLHEHLGGYWRKKFPWKILEE